MTTKNGHTSAKANLYQMVTDKIIELLESQQLSWNIPWVSIGSGGKPQHNAESGRPYSGINQLWLSIVQSRKGYHSSGWLTFNQIKKLGGSVIKGERSSEIFFSKMLWMDDNKKLVSTEKVEEMTEAERKQCGLINFWSLRYYRVFNVTQTKNLPDEHYAVSHKPEISAFELDDQAESLVNATDATIIHRNSDRAFYNVADDVIVLPNRDQFTGKEAYYETVIHELAHWTGHDSRLNRPMMNTKGDDDYAKEELIAELTSAYLCADLGHAKGIKNHAAYIQSWISVLRDDNRFIFKAAASAEKAAKFIRSFSEVTEAVD